MLSIHYVSIMMRIFYIDWQQRLECDRTMNIGANAHGKWTVSTKQPQVTNLTSVSPLTVGLPVTSEWYWASFQVTRLFHSATIFCCYICICCLKLHRADNTRLKCFFYLDLLGSTQLQWIYYLRCILISRAPRVIWRFKRRSFYISPLFHAFQSLDLLIVKVIWKKSNVLFISFNHVVSYSVCYIFLIARPQQLTKSLALKLHFISFIS